MATIDLEKLIALIDTLADEDRDILTQHLTGKQSTGGSGDNELYSEAEIRDMMTINPASGKDIVREGLQSGAIGSWADKGISDPVEWLQQQRKNRFQW